MPSVVLDASLALQWELPDERSPEATAVLQQWRQGMVAFQAPSLFWAEVANGLYRACRRGRITPTEARDSLDDLSRMNIETVDVWDSKEAFDLAVQHQARAVYDFVYVLTARLLNMELWSGDRRLVNTVGPNAGVRYVGS